MERQVPIKVDVVICVFAFREPEEEGLPDIHFQFDQINFKKGKENFRSKIFVNSQQAHDLSALSAVKGEYCSIFCHPDNNNLNQYQYQYHHQPHQYSNPHQH